MSLRDQMAVDACAILNTEELGERALWTPYGNTTGIKRTVRLIEQPDSQTIRRANVWTVRDGTTTTQGDLFRIKRGSVTSTWRVLYTDPAETAMQRSYCHLQLTDMLTITNRIRAYKQSGSTSGVQEKSGTSYRCHWFESSAEVTEENRRRSLQGEWYCLLEIVPDLKTDILLTDSSGKFFRIDRLERAYDRSSLPYMVCTRSDA